MLELTGDLYEQLEPKVDMKLNINFEFMISFWQSPSVGLIFLEEKNTE